MYAKAVVCHSKWNEQYQVYSPKKAYHIFKCQKVESLVPLVKSFW